MNTPLDPNVLLRKRFHTFYRKSFLELFPGEQLLPAPHIELMCDRLERIARGEIKRLIINLPPRHGKSTVVSVAFVAWYMGLYPDKKFLVASYAEDLASKLSRDTRTLMTTKWFQRAFPSCRIDAAKNTESEFQTTMRGVRKGTSIFGSTTGFGADILIIDDPMKAAETSSATSRQRVKDAYDHGLFSRLNDKENGAIIVVQQRLHQDDLCGHVEERGGSEVLKLPAIAVADESIEMLDSRVFVRRKGEALFPAKEPLQRLEANRLDIGLAAFEAHYQQDPATVGAGLIDWSWFRQYDKPLSRYQLVVQSWDTAGKDGSNSDFSVGMTFGFTGREYHLLEIMRGRWLYPDIRAMVLYRKAYWRADKIIVESAGTGIALIADLRQRGHSIVPFPPKESKFDRLASVTARLANGEIVLPRQALWLAEFRRELMGFPNVKHDDQVDALTQFLRLMWCGKAERLVKRRREEEKRQRRLLYSRTLHERILDSYDRDAPTPVLGGV